MTQECIPARPLSFETNMTGSVPPAPSAHLPARSCKCSYLGSAGHVRCLMDVRLGARQVELLTEQVRVTTARAERMHEDSLEEDVDTEFENSIPELQASLASSNYKKAQARCGHMACICVMWSIRVCGSSLDSMPVHVICPRA